MQVEKILVPKAWHGAVPLFFGYQEPDPTHRFGPRVRSYYLFHYIFKGKGTFIYGDKAYTVGEGDLFIIHPDEVTTYSADPIDPYEYSWLAVQIPAEPAFLRHHIRSSPGCKHLFETLKRLLLSKGAESGDSATVFSVCYRLLELLSEGEQGQGSVSCAAYVKQYIDANYMKPVSMTEIAGELHLDSRYMASLFREAFGVPPRTYLIRTRLEKARELLRRGYRPTEVSTIVGFSDFSNFSRKYKQMYGISPGREPVDTDSIRE